MINRLAFIFLLILINTACKGRIPKESGVVLQVGNDYPYYGGNKAGNRYSPLKQINIENVNNLQVAWSYNSDSDQDTLNMKKKRSKSIQCQPIVVKGVLYGTNPDLDLFAVDAATGKEIWTFSPSSKLNKSHITANRGVVYWEKENDRRVLFTIGSVLYAINADNGLIIPDFGNNGTVDLHEGLSDNLENDVNELAVSATTPGVVFKDLLILGSSVSERGDAAPGHIRAFNIVTGKLEWVFRTIPHPGELGYDTWPKDAYKEIGGANNWGGLVVDDKRGRVYFGTGSPASDFYGGNREGKNLFANCVISLNARTGKMQWYYQTIYHDLWDRDHPCPPNLTTIRKDGKNIDVVVEATKDGLVYVLDRDTGKSIFPVEELHVPVNGLPGEHPWPVQKFPVKPLPLSNQVFKEEDITNLSPDSKSYVKDISKKYSYTNKFTPPSEQGTLLFGYSGGVEWGGNAIDPDGVFYQNANNDPWLLQMTNANSRKEQLANVSHGNALYLLNCAACHGVDKKGSSDQFPDLSNLSKRLNQEQVETIIKTGSGRMPSFDHLTENDRKAIANYLFDIPTGMHANTEVLPENDQVEDSQKTFGFEPDYAIKSWKKLEDQNGYPGIKPPWGTLNAIDLNTGEYLWRVPLGEYPELKAKGIPATGTENYGGPVVTAGGLVFIAAAKDEKIRAFDKKTGKIVWEHTLPAAGFATPISYMVDGKQYIAIACGGGRGQKSGSQYVAFALTNRLNDIVMHAN